MTYYTCDICDTPNLVDVNNVVVSIKVNGTWFGDKQVKQVCPNCLLVSGYHDFVSITMSSGFFKTVWGKLWK